jgi:prolyl-tRNA editing enzyme YbaK/EbsC (Cys-tRNA(Pro) deacylase)
MPSSTPTRFQTLAAAVGVEVTVSEFPAGTRTAVDAALAVGCDVDAIVKSLVFIADDRPVLVLMSGGNRVDEARLAAATGTRTVRKASADEVRAATGYAIGGTPPFGHTGTGVSTVLLDPTLLEHTEVWAAAGTPSSVFAIDPAQLVAVAGADIVMIAQEGSP